MPILVPQLEALLPKVRACLGSYKLCAILVMLNWYRQPAARYDFAPYRTAKFGRSRKTGMLSHSEGLDLYLAPDSEILETVLVRCPGMTQMGCA